MSSQDLGIGPNGGKLRRLSFSFTSDATTVPSIFLIYPNGASATTTATYLHSAQVEIGLRPTTLIITGATTASRSNSDYVYQTISGFTMDEFTIFGEFICPENWPTTGKYVTYVYLSITDRTIVQVNSGLLSLSVIGNNTNQFVTTDIALTVGTKYRFAYSINGASKIAKSKVTGIAQSQNGLYGGLTTYTPPLSPNRLYIGGSNVLTSPVSMIGLLDRAMTDAEIAAWTG